LAKRTMPAATFWRNGPCPPRFLAKFASCEGDCWRPIPVPGRFLAQGSFLGRIPGTGFSAGNDSWRAIHISAGFLAYAGDCPNSCGRPPLECGDFSPLFGERRGWMPDAPRKQESGEKSPHSKGRRGMALCNVRKADGLFTGLLWPTTQESRERDWTKHRVCQANRVAFPKPGINARA
jgi:hypothetical protein